MKTKIALNVLSVLKVFVLILLPIQSHAAAEEISIGDTVTTNDYFTVQVKEIYPNGLVKVTLGGAVYSYKIEQLSKPITCLKDFCVGQEVTTDDNFTMSVKQVFPDGTVKLTIGYSIYTYKINQISKPIQCLQDICVGDEVSTDDHFIGNVRKIFPNGKVKVALSEISLYTYNIQQLSKKLSCIKDMCIGDEVLTDDGFKASVVSVFPDETVSVRIGYARYSYKVEQLNKSVSCLRTDGQSCQK